MRWRWLVAAAVLWAALGHCAVQTLELGDHTRIELVSTTDGTYWGVGGVTIDGVPVCAQGPPMRPVIETTDGTAYARTVLDSIDEGARCAVICKLVERDTSRTDELRLVLRQAEEMIGGKWYVGFAYQYVFRSESNIARRVFDFTHWELGGSSAGLYMVPPHRYTTDDPVTVRRMTEFLRSPCFYYQGGDAGSLVVAYEFDEAAPMIYTEMEKPAGDGPTQFVDEIQLVPGNEVHTPWRYVMLHKQDGLEGLEIVDEYTRCHDHFVSKVRDHFGIPAEPTRRLCIRAAEDLRPGGTVQTYDDVIEMLPELKALGFERVWPGCIWDNGGGRETPPRPDLSILSMGISPFGGGEDGLRRLCDAADKLDMKVYTWAPSGQLVTESEYWRTNPEWFARREDGSRYSYGASSLTWTDLNSGYYEHSLEGLRNAREIGVAGLWFDSFRAVASAVNYADPLQPKYNIVPAFKRMAYLLNDLEYENIYTEGEGPAGIDGYPEGHLDTGGYKLYKSGKFYYHIRPTETNWYFRMLANRATPLVAFRYSLRTYRGNALTDHPVQMDRVRYANEAFKQARPHMTTRTLLKSADDPWECVGVRWDGTDKASSVYWAYGDMRLRLNGEHRVREIVSGAEVQVESEGAPLTGEHVYLVEKVDQ